MNTTIVSIVTIKIGILSKGLPSQLTRKIKLETISGIQIKNPPIRVSVSQSLYPSFLYFDRRILYKIKLDITKIKEFINKEIPVWYLINSNNIILAPFIH